MILNYIWVILVLLSILTGVVQLFISGDVSCLDRVLQSTFTSAKSGFEISLGLTGVMALWMGIMKIGERGGVIDQLSRCVSPFLSKLFPELGSGSPAFGKMVMNLSATMLGIDNAATPFGLEAMKEMQDCNKDKFVASNSMIMFLVLVTSGLTLVPVSIMTYRSELHANNPADIFIPILLSTYCAALGGVLLTAIIQRINLFKRNLIIAFIVLTSIVVLFIILGVRSDASSLGRYSGGVAALFLLSIVVWFIVVGVKRRVNVYDAFIDGAKGAFTVAIGIVPYLIAILVAVGMFRASGGMDIVIGVLKGFVDYIGLDSRFVPCLPTALMRPLSGSGARGMMLDAMMEYGVDSFVGRLVSVVQGATDTTFYIIAVYFGSVNIKQTRYAIVCGLFADFCGIVSAIIFSYIFFG